MKTKRPKENPQDTEELREQFESYGNVGRTVASRRAAVEQVHIVSIVELMEHRQGCFTTDGIDLRCLRVSQ